MVLTTIAINLVNMCTPSKLCTRVNRIILSKVHNDLNEP